MSQGQHNDNVLNSSCGGTGTHVLTFQDGELALQVVEHINPR
jgi:hypothetical protein